MFKIVLLIGVLLAISAEAAPTDQKLSSEVEILSSNNEPLNEDLQYSFNFKQSDGQEREEEGTFYEIEGSDKLEYVVRGSYQFFGPDGVLYSVTYTADDNGFRPEGEHLPGYVSTTEEPVQLSHNAVLSLVG